MHACIVSLWIGVLKWFHMIPHVLLVGTFLKLSASTGMNIMCALLFCTVTLM